MIQARLELNDYTVRVLDVVKGKFGLKNRSEALQRLALDAGADFVEPKADEMVLRELDAVYENHKRKHGKRTMNDKELRKLLNV